MYMYIYMYRRQLTLANEQSGKLRCEVFEAEQALEEAKASFKAKIGN